ncbi:hypothetical protein LCGC14_2628110 [marine sediment metagenome]|uniref:Uncharacterized protein n=1 Tax=marine sediment metagenome TaxID=412755 RepID=A0A0F9ANQ4_9ZZZZ
MPINTKDTTVAEAMTKAQRKAKLAQVLDRGMVSDRLVVKDADPRKHYEWCRDTEIDIDRWRSLGFEVEQEKGEGLHGKGDDRRVVGDAVLMSCSKQNFEILEELKAERKERKRRMNAKKEYLMRARKFNPDIPVLDPLNVEGSEE